MLYPEDYEEDELQKIQTRRAVFWLAFLIGLALLLSVVAAHAESFSMADGQGNSVQLLDEPCFDAPPWLGWRKAAMVYQGKSYEACWRVFGSMVLILDSAGDSSPVPVSAFRKDEGT